MTYVANVIESLAPTTPSEGRTGVWRTSVWVTIALGLPRRVDTKVFVAQAVWLTLSFASCSVNTETVRGLGVFLTVSAASAVEFACIPKLASNTNAIALPLRSIIVSAWAIPYLWRYCLPRDIKILY